MSDRTDADAATPSITVGYKPIQSVHLVYHKYITYHDGAGNTEVIEVQPKLRGGLDLLTNPGLLQMQVETHSGDDIDEWNRALRNDHTETIATGATASDAWDKVKEAMNSLQGSDYYLLGPNSNSAVDTALNRAGLPEPLDDDGEEEGDDTNPGERNAPGSGNIIPENPGDDDDTPQKKPLEWPGFDDPPVSPLVLDLDGDGVELTSLEASQTLFDLDADGFAQRTGWVKPDDGLLAIDRNGNGRIDDITELFGDGDTDGFTELRALDSNSDGVINAQDTEFANLKVWQDRDQDGVSDTDELQSLTAARITSINANATETSTKNAGHEVSHTSTFTKGDGTTGTIVDVWFENDRHISRVTTPPSSTTHDEAAWLPNLAGYGTVASLAVAMTRDAGLRETVRALVADSNTTALSAFRTKVDAMVLQWTGADGTDPASRGPGMDARHLAAMEALMGRRFHHDDEYGADPGPIAALELEAHYQDFIDMTAARLLAQSAVSAASLASTDGSTLDLATAYGHRFIWLAELTYNSRTNELTGSLSDILSKYVSRADDASALLNNDDTIALLRMLRLDFGQDETAYRTAVQAAFVAAGFTATVAAGYADQAIEPHVRYINGTDGDDRLQGTAINDVLVGGRGNDTYVWGSGQGNDVTDEEGGENDVDRLVLEGLTPDDILVTKMSGNGYDGDLRIVIRETGEWLILDDQRAGGGDDIEQVVFANGVTWSKEELTRNAFDQVLTGSDNADVLSGNSGNDYIEGGLGDDTLSGKDGSDVYVFNRGDGVDSIEDGGFDDTDRLVERRVRSSAPVRPRPTVTRSATAPTPSPTLTTAPTSTGWSSPMSTPTASPSRATATISCSPCPTTRPSPSSSSSASGGTSSSRWSSPTPRCGRRRICGHACSSISRQTATTPSMASTVTTRWSVDPATILCMAAPATIR